MNNVLEIKNLVKKYNHCDTNAVNNISFDVKSGEFFCLLGVNGAGKSTTINMICTLLKKTSGSIMLNSYEIGVNDDEIRKSIGVVFQNNVLDGVLTVQENLMIRSKFYGYDKETSKKKVEYLAQELQITDFIKSPYNKLSGGQRRKCDVARALLSEPKILFLDEPTTGLDPQSRIELWETIDHFRQEKNMTIFLTTHYMEETQNSDRIAIIEKGNILCIDTPQMLKSKYSTDVLKLIVKDNLKKELEKHISGFVLQGDTYTINIKNNLDSIELLNKVKPFIHSFEMKKGDMDNVFLNVVGRKYNERII